MSIITYHGVNLIILVSFLILLAGEGIAAIARRQDHPRQTLKETGTSLAVATMFAVGNAGISLFVVALYSYVYVLTPIHVPDIWHSSTSVLGFTCTVVIAFVWTDFMYYWGHRGGHTIRVMWASHSVHHSSKEFNYSTAGRLHPLRPCCRNLAQPSADTPGLQPHHRANCWPARPRALLFFHTQYVKKLPRPIEYVFNTRATIASTMLRRSSTLDSNFGAIFMVWDRVFGTYAEEEDLPTYGLTKPIETQNPVKVMSHGWVELIHDPRWINQVPSASSTSSSAQGGRRSQPTRPAEEPRWFVGRLIRRGGGQVPLENVAAVAVRMTLFHICKVSLVRLNLGRWAGVVLIRQLTNHIVGSPTLQVARRHPAKLGVDSWPLAHQKET